MNKVENSENLNSYGLLKLLVQYQLLVYYNFQKNFFCRYTVRKYQLTIKRKKIWKNFFFSSNTVQYKHWMVIEINNIIIIIY